MTGYREISFSDELLADGSVHRRFSDGRQEWRRRGPGPLVTWRDSQGRGGTDEPLGQRIIKRGYSTGQVVYGRDQGWGRTAWADRTLTVNRTLFTGRMGALFAGVGAGVLLGAVVAPPLALSPAEEDELRRQAQQRGDDSHGDGAGDRDWDDGGDGDGGSDDDFG